jgi:hypothetical protein
MNFRYRTADGRMILPCIRLGYQCKRCGYLNELVLLIGKGCQFANPSGPTPHESICHQCDDVEVITCEQEKNT